MKQKEEFSFIQTYIRLVRSGLNPAEAYKQTEQLRLNRILTPQRPQKASKKDKPTSKT